ncbi:MAG TPA: carboxymuconolactone decarboxylase family protein, partial [Geminicoccaceae bacterium]|nr:carboxymuconolactone decarboxylase family protein [Geminicoccaceae bacterium]
ASLFLVASSAAQAQQPDIAGRRLSPEDVRKVAPALERYTQDRLYGEVWKRPGLTPRDRSLVTVSALIASGQVAQIPYHLNRAMDKLASSLVVEIRCSLAVGDAPPPVA